MRVVITGGTGLIGRALSADLAADGHEVIVLSRSPERATHLPGGVQAEHWDARSAKGWGHLADGAASIVNLAGASLAGEGFFPTRWTDERRRVVIQSSAIGYYGFHGDDWAARFTAKRMGAFNRVRRGDGCAPGRRPHRRGAQY